MKKSEWVKSEPNFITLEHVKAEIVKWLGGNEMSWLLKTEKEGRKK